MDLRSQLQVMQVRAASTAADTENFEKEVSAIDRRLVTLHSDCDELFGM